MALLHSLTVDTSVGNIPEENTVGKKTTLQPKAAQAQVHDTSGLLSHRVVPTLSFGINLHKILELFLLKEMFDGFVTPLCQTHPRVLKALLRS